jgi:signal transduction histidine kinase
LEPDMKSLGSYLEHQDALQASTRAAAAGVSNGVAALDELESLSSGKWLSEWGSPTDILEFTRAQIFDELLRLRDDERQRIGQELHDSAGQLVLALQLNLARLHEAERHADCGPLIEEIQDTARLIGQEIRSLAFLNHPIHMHPSGLASALQALMDGFRKRTGCRVYFSVVGEQPLGNRASSMALLRIAQEAMVNVHRHAHATCICAKLETRGNRLALTIRDDGVGMPSSEEIATNGGVGVQGMRFRVEQLGGRFQIAKLKHGTKISASVPIAA